MMASTAPDPPALPPPTQGSSTAAEYGGWPAAEAGRQAGKQRAGGAERSGAYAWL